MFMRPVLMVLMLRSGLTSLQDISVATLRSVPTILGLVVWLLGSTLVATALWGTSPQYSEFFRTLSFLQTCITTANFPDIMMSEYSATRSAFVFYFVFLVVGNFFVLSLILGEIRVAYTKTVDNRQLLFVRARKEELVMAFASLSTGRVWVSSREVMRMYGSMAVMFWGMGESDEVGQRERAHMMRFLADSNVINQQCFLAAAVRATTAIIDRSHPIYRRFLSR